MLPDRIHDCAYATLASTPSLFRESSCRLECYLSSRTILLPINPGCTAGYLTCVATDGRSKHCGSRLLRSSHSRLQRAYCANLPQLNFGVIWPPSLLP